jgi:hypothetical protein
MRLTAIGDIQQTGSVEWGAPFEQLQRYGMSTVKMVDILRQKEGSDLKEALLKTKTDQTSEALNKINYTVYEIKEKEERLESLVESYLSFSPQDQRDNRIGVITREDRDWINLKIREVKQKEGELGEDKLIVQVLDAADLTQAEKRISDFYQIGQIVHFNRKPDLSNSFIQANQYYAIQHINKSQNALILSPLLFSCFSQFSE